MILSFSLGKVKEKIIREELHESGKYTPNEVEEILSVVEGTLHNYCVSCLGKIETPMIHFKYSPKSKAEKMTWF